MNGLGWMETSVDRGDGTSEFSGFEAETPFGTFYVIEIHGDAFTVEYDMTKIGEADTPDEAKRIGQRDFERRIRMALIPVEPQRVPDDEIDYDDPKFNQGVQHVVDLLSKTLGAEGWVAGDGSEDYDCDLEQTLLNILAAKGLYDKDEGEFASLAVSRPHGESSASSLAGSAPAQRLPE